MKKVLETDEYKLNGHKTEMIWKISFDKVSLNLESHFDFDE